MTAQVNRSIETALPACYMRAMIGRRKFARPLRTCGGTKARTTIAFAAIGDHARLPARFFPRLNACDGSLLGA